MRERSLWGRVVLATIVWGVGVVVLTDVSGEETVRYVLLGWLWGLPLGLCIGRWLREIFRRRGWL